MRASSLSSTTRRSSVVAFLATMMLLASCGSATVSSSSTTEKPGGTSDVTTTVAGNDDPTTTSDDTTTTTKPKGTTTGSGSNSDFCKVALDADRAMEDAFDSGDFDEDFDPDALLASRRTSPTCVASTPIADRFRIDKVVMRHDTPTIGLSPCGS